MRKKFSIPRGFTLIELLVVIAIIAVLSALLMVNFVGIRQRARDATRKSDLRQIQSALELYRADQNGYPAVLPACGTALSAGSPTINYLPKTPCDPLLSSAYLTCFNQANAVYALRACLENTSDSQVDPANAPTPLCNPVPTCGSGTGSYTLQSP